jgi:hypothetical protein
MIYLSPTTTHCRPLESAASSSPSRRPAAAAQRYDPHRGGIGLRGFGGKYMTIADFYEQVS